MATTGEGFAIALGIYVLVIIAVFLLFSYWRRLKLTAKFYAPKRYKEGAGYTPPPLDASFGGWVKQVIWMGERELVKSAGVDAALYCKFLRMGMELFLVVSLLVLIIIMPINLTSGEVDKLMAAGNTGYNPKDVSPWTFWIPPAPGPSEDGSSEPSDPVEPPALYNTSIDDPPPGLIWWQYLPGVVPPLPEPEDIYGPTVADYGWRLDDSYTVTSYTFTDLDKTTMANIPSGSDRMYAHMVLTYIIAGYAMWLFWKYCHQALRLRMYYLLNTPKGAESHTVLCTDIPGIVHGTIPKRLDTLLRFVPKNVREKAQAQVSRLKSKRITALPTSSSSKNNTGTRISAAGTGMEVAPPPESPISSPATAKRVEAVPISVEGPSSSFSEVLLSSPSNSATGPATPAGAAGDLEFNPPDRWGQACDDLDAGHDVHDMVEHAFKTIYTDSFSHAHTVCDTVKLDSLVQQYEKVKLELTDMIDEAVTRHRKGMPLKDAKVTVIGAKFGAWGREKYGLKPSKQSAIIFKKELFEHLYEEVLTAQTTATATLYPTAFITFSRRTSQVVASYSLMSEDLTTWRCQPAPAPEEVLWRNLGLRAWERSARSMVMWVAYFLLLCFFMIPVTAIQGLLSLESLGVEWVADIAILNSLVTSILPGLALTIFLALLPAILTAMNKFAGMVSSSQVDFGIITRFFYFQVVTVFFASFIAGSFANQLEQFIDDPGSIVTILGTAAPQTALFFMTFLAVQAGTAIPLSLLRLVPLVIFKIKSKLTATHRARARLWGGQMLQYGTLIPGDTMAILLGVTFSCICPLIAPVALMYFGIAYIVRKHNFVYVYGESYQSGGAAWTRIFNQLITGLLIFEITMIALLGVKETIAPPLILLPLPFITLIYARAAHSTFWKPMQTLSMLSAAKLDMEESAFSSLLPSKPYSTKPSTGLTDLPDTMPYDSSNTIKAGTSSTKGTTTINNDTAESELDKDVHERYISPSFKVSDKEHGEVLHQAGVLEQVLISGDASQLKQLDIEVDEGSIEQGALHMNEGGVG